MFRRTLIRSIAVGAALLAVVSLTIAAQHTKREQAQRPKKGAPAGAARPLWPQPAPGTQRVMIQHGKDDVEVLDVPATGRFVPWPDGTGLRQLLPDEITPAWEVVADHVGLGTDPARPDARLALAEKLARVLTKAAPAVAGREAHFQWINREDSPLIFRGWHARLRQLEEAPGGGWHVTLWVWPVAMTKGGTWAFVSGIHVEEYAVDAAGNVTPIRDYPHPTLHGSEGGFGSG